MEPTLVRVVTTNVVFALGYPLPIPEGFEPEPFIVRDLRIKVSVDTESGEESSELQIILSPDLNAAGLVKEDMEEEEWAAIESYHLKAVQAVEDNLAMLVTAQVTDDMRFEYLATQDVLEEILAEEVKEAGIETSEEPANEPASVEGSSDDESQ